MYKKVFVSHSTKNAWLIDDFLALIRKASPGIELFCSSEAVIPPSNNYKKVIYSKLEDADMFIAILSDEYWKSKYAIMELGAAYQRYCFDNRTVSIQPVVVPPLDKGMALANTPLVEMQITDLTDTGSVKLFLEMIASPDMSERIGDLLPAISEFCAFVRSTVLSNTSLSSGISFGAYYQEPENNPIPKERIVRCQEIKEGRFLMDYHFSRLDYTPSFASIALEYWDPVNFTEYLRYDKDAAFSFTVENTDGALNYINVEFKFGETHRIFRTVRIDLEPGTNKVSVPLGSMNQTPLSEINQICFVIIPQDVNVPDGEFIIDDIDVDFEVKNILN